MAGDKKLDLYKANKDEYAASKVKPQLVQTHEAQYLTVEGQGEPGGDVFQAKVGAMYSMAFTIKMTRKFAGQGDYKIAPLEGLWWVDGSGTDFFQTPRETWRWKLLIRTPDAVGPDDLARAGETLRSKNKPPGFEAVRLERICEGQCVQMLHVGPYATEAETIAKMLKLADENGLSLHGLHHEIYLSDPRRVPPERLRTILRLPVTPKQ